MAIELGTLIDNVGLATLGALYPKDFEYYFCSLELINSSGRIVNYFAFPVLPDSISTSNPTVAQVRKTFGGVSVIDNPHFVPGQIQLQGSFGRSLKLLLGREQLGFTALNINNFSKDLLGIQLKTGFGCCKILQDICRQSHELDEYENPHWLIFHNLAFGESWYVSSGDVTFSQDQSNNVIWRYSLPLTTLGPVKKVGGRFKAAGLIAGQSVIQRATTSARSLIKSIKL